MKKLGLKDSQSRVAQAGHGHLDLCRADRSCRRSPSACRALGELRLHGHGIGRAVGLPPGAGDQLVALGKLRRPGEIGLTLPRALSLVSAAAARRPRPSPGRAASGRALPRHALGIEQGAHRTEFLRARCSTGSDSARPPGAALPAIEERGAQQVSSSSSMIDTANTTSCSALPTPWRCRLASARRQTLPACIPGGDRRAAAARRPVPPQTTTAASPASTTA
jgi:hypothetical protein